MYRGIFQSMTKKQQILFLTSNYFHNSKGVKSTTPYLHLLCYKTFSSLSVFSKIGCSSLGRNAPATVACNCSTSSIEMLILNNECVVQKYLSRLMEEFRTDNEELKKQFGKQTLQSYKIANLMSTRISICDSLASLHDLKLGIKETDEEMKALIELERCDYDEKLSILDMELITCVIPEEPYDKINDVIIEIKNGVGGQEAMLFAGDLCELYCGYAEYKGWSFNVEELAKSELGGVRSSSIVVCGHGALKHYCYEAGVHRVQRVPTTEKTGRMHTSTVSVAVFPQPTEVEVKLNEGDLKIETKKSSGAGGQHVNTTDSAVRIVHLPTGIAVECQTERSQIKNKKSAMKKLRAKLYEIQSKDQMTKINRTRKLQMGSGERSEKIRTYNFQQDRITDHRIGLTLHHLETFLTGSEGFDKLVSELKKESERERVAEFIESLK